MASERILELKKKETEQIGEIVSKSGAYFFDYRGLSVKEMEELRNKIKAHDSNVKVIKNRLAIKFFDTTDKELGREQFKGLTAVAYSDEKFIEVAKEIVDFEKENKKIKIKFGLIEDKVVDVDQIKSIAQLPSKEQLMAQLAFSIAMPLKKWGMAMSAPLTNMLVLLKNLKDKKEKEGEK